MKLKYRAIAGGAFFALAQIAQATTYYVNTNATGDSWAGTSNVFPIKTLKRAATIVQSGDTLLLYRGSIWEESLPVISGVTYADYGPATNPKPVVRGSHDLSALTWTLYQNGIYMADVSGLPANASGNPFEAVTQIFYNGERLVKARYPNLDVKYFQTGNTSNLNNQLTFKPADFPTGQNPIGATAHLVFGGYYQRDFIVASAVTAGTLYNLTEQPFDPYHFPSFTPFSWASVVPGDGYWLENQLWMLDAEKEWFYDAGTKKLYVKLPGSVTPQNKNIYGSIKYTGADPVGIDCVSNNCVSTSVTNIEVRETVGDGVFFKGSSNITLSNVDVTRPGSRGIALPGTSTSSVIAATVSSSLRDGIWLGDNSAAATLPGTLVSVSGSTVSDAGRGLYAGAGIAAGFSSSITSNNVYRSGYIGIRMAKNATADHNYLEDSCYEFGDCGAIVITNLDQAYQTVDGYPLNATISNNIINRTNLSATPNLGMKNGIYLDGMSRLVTVQNNFVQGVDNGIFGNMINSNTITGNVLFKSHANELNMQEQWYNSDHINACNYYGLTCGTTLDFSTGNTISNNTFVHSSGTPSIRLLSNFGTTSDFGTFSQNRYLNLSQDRIVFDSSIVNPPQVKTLAEWQAQGQDSTSSQYNNLNSDSVATGAPNLIINSTFETGDVGDGNHYWWFYNNANFNTVSTGCQTGYGNCLLAQVVNSTTNGGVSGSKNLVVYTTGLSQSSLSVVPGKTYLLNLDAKTDGSSFQLSGVMADGGGVPYTEPGSALLNGTWQHITRRLYVDSSNGTNPLRLQFNVQGPNGGSVYLDNVTLYEDTLTGGNVDAAYSFVNANTVATSVTCPAVNTSLCGSYKDAVTGSAVTFPLSVPARSGVVIRLN